MLRKSCQCCIGPVFTPFDPPTILGDPWAASGDEEKSKRAEKYMA